jgi:cell surface protein SprA
MVNRRLNEQSLQLCIDDLEDGKAKGAYKNVNYNFLNYERVKMFVHGESKDPYMKDGQMEAFLRIGTDNTQNYYEISVPLKLSNLTDNNPNDLWPIQNEIDFAITDLTNVKLERNKSINNDPTLKVFSFPMKMPNGQTITVVGNPDLSTVQTLMIGFRNPYNGDKKTATACLWADELRLTGFVNSPSYATTARLNLKLADLATVNLSGKYTTVGWGALDQKVSQRERINTGQWGVQSNIALDKFIPEKVGIKLPMFVSFDQTLLAPKYDPLDPDVLLKNSLANISDPQQRSDYKSFVVDKTNRHSINFTNIQKVRTKKDAKPRIYDIENLSLTTAYSVTRRTNINIKDYTQKYYKGEVVYAFNSTPKNYEPLKNAKWAQSKYLKLIRDLNVTPMPSSLSFRSSLERRLTRTQYYEGNPRDHIYQDPLFEKQFTFTRNYGLNWAFTKSLTLDFKANAYSIIDEPNRDPNIDKRGYNDSLLSNVLRGGRLKNYDHQVGATYKLPIDKLPFTDWVSADAKYSAGYAWASGALKMRDTLGNVVQNNQTSGLTGKINLEKIYNKVKFLRDINNPPPPLKAGQKDTSKTLPKRDWKGVKAMVKTLMLLKNINFTYDITRATTLPGYMPIPKYMGFTPGGNGMEMAPFIFGSQSPDIRYIAANNGWLSKSYSLNSPFTQSKMRSFIAKTQIEPIKDMRIQLDMSVKKSTNYQELFKWHYLDSMNAYSGYGSLSPNRTGSISISVISIRTAFAGTVKGSGDPNSSATFAEFERDRDILRSRMPHLSPYDTNSQSVLLPAFLAAYTKRDPHKVAMNPYPSFPLPNWRIDYQGLTKIKAIKKIFPSFTISHAYQSTYNINNYNSSLKYGSDTINPYNDLNNSPFPGLTNSSGASIPIYIIEAVNITEAFNPLIGINFRTNNKLTGNFQLKRARTITLNLNNVQVQEILSTDVTVGIGVIKTNTKIPFLKIPPLKNELNAKMDIVVGDRKTIQRKFDQAAAVTAGNLNIQIRPNITYAINQRVNVMMYFERTINSPKISSSYKNSSTRFGFQVRFTLS